MANVHPRADDIRPYGFYQGGIEIVGGDVPDALFFEVTAKPAAGACLSLWERWLRSATTSSTAVRRSPSPSRGRLMGAVRDVGAGLRARPFI